MTDYNIYSGQGQKVSSATLVDPVNKAMFGQTIPLLFGGTRILTSSMWAAPLVVNADGSRVLTFATIVGRRGPLTSSVKLVKVFINGTIVYDASSVGNTNQSFKFAFYDGSESQQADQTIASFEGAANTPAFRDRIYLVITGWTIPVGGDFPVVVVEVNQTITTSGSSRLVTPYATGNSNGYTNNIRIDWRDGRMLMNVSGSNPMSFDVFNVNTQSFAYNVVMKYPSAAVNGAVAFSKADDTLYGTVGNDFSTGLFIGWDSSGAERMRLSGSSVGGPDSNHGGMSYSVKMATSWGTANYDEWILSGSVSGDFTALRRNGYTISLGYYHSYGSVSSANITQILPINMSKHAPANDVCAAYLAIGNTIALALITETGASTTLSQADVLFDQIGVHASGNPPYSSDTYTVSVKSANFFGTVLTNSTNDMPQWMMLDPDGGKWLAVLSNDVVTNVSHFRLYDTFIGKGTTSPAKIDQYKVFTGNVWMPISDPVTAAGGFSAFAQLSLVFESVIPTVLINPTEIVSKEHAPPGSTFVGYTTVTTVLGGVTLSGRYVVLNMRDGTWTTYPTGSWANAAGGGYGGADFNNSMIYDPVHGSVYYGYFGVGSDYPGYAAMADAGGSSGSLLKVSDLVTSLGLLAQYQLSDISTSGIDDSIDGAIVNVQTNFFDVASKIAQLFRIDVLESGGQIKFHRKVRGLGFAVDRTLTEDDLAPVSQNAANDGTLLLKDRDATADLPSSLQLTYIDSNNDYQVGLQVAKRTTFPYRTSSGTYVQSIDVPVAMPAAKALYWAEFSLFDEWAGALTVTGRLPVKHLDLEPGDYVNVTTLANGSYTLKLTKVMLNADWSVSVIGSSVVTIEPSTDTISDINVASKDKSVLDTSSFKFWYIDNCDLNIPPDGTPAGQTPIAFYADALIDVFFQVPGDVLRQVSTTKPVSYGVLLADLPAAGEPDTIDYYTQVKVKMLSGTVVGTDDATFYLPTTSRIAVGQPGRWEIIKYRNVGQLSDGTFVLSTLIRGRQGTDGAAGSRKGDTVLILTGSVPAVAQALAGPATVSAPFTATHHGQGLTAGSAQQGSLIVTSGGVRPFRVTNPHVALSGSDLVLTWQRRDRSATDLQNDGLETVPLSETSESYDLELMLDNGTIVRTVAGLTSATYTYTAAQIAADGTYTDHVNINVYQNSSVVGRGFKRNATLWVT